MASDQPDLPSWLTSREKYIACALLNCGFYHHINHQSGSDEDDELFYMQKVYGCKVGFAGCENYICVIINGCELCLFLGDSISSDQAKFKFERVKATVRKYHKLWDVAEAINAMNRSKQLPLF